MIASDRLISRAGAAYDPPEYGAPEYDVLGSPTAPTDSSSFAPTQLAPQASTTARYM